MQPTIHLKKTVRNHERYYEVVGFSGIEDYSKAPRDSPAYITRDGNVLAFHDEVDIHIGDIFPAETWERRLHHYVQIFAEYGALIAKLDATTKGWDGTTDVIFPVVKPNGN